MRHRAENTAVAYEPVWAIGTGRTPSAGDVAVVHRVIRAALIARFGTEGSEIRILYGGSVNPGNARELIACRQRERCTRRRREPQGK